MSEDLKRERTLAVQRFFNGESPRAICTSLDRSRFWLYKWVNRFDPEDPAWCESRSTKPSGHPRQIPSEVEEMIIKIRLDLHEDDLFCGAQAILWEMEDLGVFPLPSERTINRVLARNNLILRQTGPYEPKGTPYPKLSADKPNQTHQADLVGPRYLKGSVRFHSQNVLDLASARCGLEPLLSKAKQSIINAFWAIWLRLGIPENLQIDNELSYHGSHKYPRGMGPLIRLCLHNGVEPWFIPMAEPWRNGAIESFNDHYKQKFLRKVTMTNYEELVEASLAFEHKHNTRLRFSRLGGKTPYKALDVSMVKLSFPKEEQAPVYPIPKPEIGRYHLVRLIRGNLKISIFGELFPVAPELQYQYVVATVDVKEQKLKLFLDKLQVDEFNYRLR
jgi:transposase